MENWHRQALVAIASSDIVLLRCIEDGKALPPEWGAYRKALREIISGVKSGPLPQKPEFP